MKKNGFLRFSGILSFCMMVMLGMSLAACSNDDEDFGNDGLEFFDEFDEDNEVGPSYENPYKVMEEGFSLQLQLHAWNREKSLTTVFQEDELIVFRFLVRPCLNFYTGDMSFDGEDDDLNVDDHFFAVYKADGKLFKKLRKHIDSGVLLQYPPILEIGSNCTLPPGDYYTKFTVKYNSTPGAEEKVWKTHTFRTDFKVVANNQ